MPITLHFPELFSSRLLFLYFFPLINGWRVVFWRWLPVFPLKYSGLRRLFALKQDILWEELVLILSTCPNIPSITIKVLKGIFCCELARLCNLAAAGHCFHLAREKALKRRKAAMSEHANNSFVALLHALHWALPAPEQNKSDVLYQNPC